MPIPPPRRANSQFDDYLKFFFIGFGALLIVLGGNLVRQEKYSDGGAMIAAGAAVIALKGTENRNKAKKLKILV